MNILIVDQTAESQTKIARFIEEFDAADKDALDVHVSLASPQNCTSRFAHSDVLILGPGLGDAAHALARQAKEIAHNIEVIMFAAQRWYSSESFRQAHIARVRKVIPESASQLDLLQELVAIHELFRHSGRTKKGKLITVVQAKGGVGSTTFIAALAELANESRSHTLLWDLDIESRDLSRGLNAKGIQSQLVTAWTNGSRELTRETLKEASIPIGSYVSLLTPPHEIAAGMDLVGHPDSIKLVHRIIELARVCHDTIIVDTAGRLGPATGTLLRMADEVVLIIEDSLLGLSAARSFLETLLPLMRNNVQAMRIVCAGTKLSSREIAKLLGEHVDLPPDAWSVPSLPVDPAAEKWPGSGSTLYSLGQKNTKRIIEEMAFRLGVSDDLSAKIKQFPDKGKRHEAGGWMRSMLQRVSNAS